jgi:hypothetical protein
MAWGIKLKGLEDSQTYPPKRPYSHFGVAHPQGIPGSGTAGPGETLGVRGYPLPYGPDYIHHGLNSGCLLINNKYIFTN